MFPPEGEFSYAVQKRSGNFDFPVRWYIADTSDLPRSTDAMYDWAGVLMDQLEIGFFEGRVQVLLDAGPQCGMQPGCELQE